VRLEQAIEHAKKQEEERRELAKRMKRLEEKECIKTLRRLKESSWSSRSRQPINIDCLAKPA
jgi:hypothetical protein